MMQLGDLKQARPGWQRLPGAGEMWEFTLVSGLKAMVYEDTCRNGRPWRSAVFVNDHLLNKGTADFRNHAMCAAELWLRMAAHRQLVKTDDEDRMFEIEAAIGKTRKQVVNSFIEESGWVPELRGSVGTGAQRLQALRREFVDHPQLADALSEQPAIEA